MTETPVRPARILVVDDHPIVRLGIRGMIDRDAGLEVCAEADTADAAAQLAGDLRPDLAIVDLSMGRGASLDLVRKLRESAPGMRVLVLSMHDEALFAERVLRAGASGYIMKQQAIDGLMDAVRQVLAGGVHVSERVAQSLKRRLGDPEPGAGGRLGNLTDRELEIFEMIGRGHNTAAIAEKLNLSVKTVETHRANIKSKLGIKDAADLIRHAASWTEHL